MSSVIFLPINLRNILEIASPALYSISKYLNTRPRFVFGEAQTQFKPLLEQGVIEPC